MDIVIFSSVIVAAIFHALWNFSVKTSKGNKVSVIWLGQIIAGLVVLPFAIYFTDFSQFSTSWLLFISATGAIHAVYISLLGWSYDLGDISVVYPVARGAGIAGTSLVAISTAIDQVSTVGVAGILMIVSGIIVLSLKELPHAAQRKALWVALSVGVSIASYSLVDKIAVADVPPFFYLAMMQLVSPFFCLPLIAGKLRRQTLTAMRTCRRDIFIVGFGGMGTYLIILWAFKNGPVSYVVALRETSVVLAAAMGVFILGEKFSKRKLLGILMILAGAACIRLA